MTDNPKLEALRELLLDDDRKGITDLAAKLKAVEAILETREEVEARIDPIISDRLESYSKAIPEKLGPAITSALRTEIANSKDQVVDALYPIIGKMIKKYLRHEMGVLRDQIEHSVKQMFSWKGLVLRLKGWVTGKSSAELILGNLEDTSLEEMMVIERNSGLLKGSYSKTEALDRDMVAGMLTAIKSFSEDAFNKEGQELDEIRYDDYNIHLFGFASFYMAVVVSGGNSASFKSKLQDTVMTFAEKYLSEQNHKVEEDGYVQQNLEEYFG